MSDVIDLNIDEGHELRSEFLTADTESTYEPDDDALPQDSSDSEEEDTQEKTNKISRSPRNIDNLEIEMVKESQELENMAITVSKKVNKGHSEGNLIEYILD